MRIPVYVLGVGLAFSVAIATAQTQQQQTPPITPTTPANQVGDGAQTKSGNPAPSSSSPANTGGVAGAASSSTAPSSPATDAANSGGGISAMSDSDLQSQIQSALSKEPTLSGDSAHANVSGDTIELAGTVGTNKEKITATRIVQSYAGSKKLVNKLTINGRSDKSSADKGTPAPESKPPQR
jgi:osmotically-inducible protein OsmY